MFKFLKNYKTKRQLREEIARLEGRLYQPVHCTEISRDILKVVATVEIPSMQYNVPIKVVKDRLLRDLSKEIGQFVEWDVNDSLLDGSKILEGTVYLAVRRNV